ANRGDCAQPCRLAFRRPNDVGEVHALSLKDLCLLDSLPELARMGAASFKIEGRMKRPEYVAAAVTACRQALDGGIDTALRGNLEDVFSRSGFTRGYYDAQRGRGMEGFRRREDVSAAKGALPSLAALYAKELPRFAVDFALTAQVGELPVLSAELAGCGVRVTVRGESAVAQSLCGGTDATRVREQLGKCGGTQFYLSVCELQLQEGAQMPISALNALRREALARLETELLRREALRCDEYMQPKISAHIAKAATLHIRVADAEQIPADLRGVSRVILPLTQSLPANLPSYVTPAVEIPRGIFGNEESVLRELRRAKSAGFASAVAGGLDGAALAMSARLPFSAGFGSNICNTQSLEEWSELGAADALISPEMQPYRAAKLGGELPRSLFAYGRLPLMLLRRCPHRGAEGCADCSAAKKPFLIDRMGKNFPLQCRGREYSEVLACNPVYLADRRRELRFADALLLYFTDESPKECAKILTAFREGTPPVGDYTRGLIDFRL
ncbi:MAG: U32 family peptidase, partial [Oscillospiraceae bacterium]|nr:U32 family peptidase [Oscillospiraceae bacterium]